MLRTKTLPPPIPGPAFDGFDVGGMCVYNEGARGPEPAAAANGELECGRGDAAAPALSPSPGLCATME